MATSPRQVFIDTNVLVYATVPTSPFHTRAQASLTALWNAGDDLWINRQVLREYAMVVTRPQAFMQPLAPAAAALQAQALSTQFRVADDTSAVTAQWLVLLQTIAVGGRQVYDANIVATMLAFGITHLHTHNTADFTRYSHLITVLPL
jgi:predicted nucleic acid-binding protein